MDKFIPSPQNLLNLAQEVRDELFPDRDAIGGDCQPAAELLVEKLEALGVEDAFARWGSYRGQPHVWVQFGNRYIDPTCDQYGEDDEPEYETGVRIGKMTDPKFMSRYASSKTSSLLVAKSDVMGQVYLLHFNEPYKHARHYLGWALNAQERIQQHENGTGARLTQVIRDAGIGFQVAKIWDDKTRRFERSLKNQGGLNRQCPICKAQGLDSRKNWQDIQVAPETAVSGPDYTETSKAASLAIIKVAAAPTITVEKSAITPGTIEDRQGHVLYDLDMKLEDGKQIGHMEVIAKPADSEDGKYEGPHLKINQVWIDPESRRQGYATLLYQRARQLAKEIGLPEIRSDYSTTPAAKKLWESMGGTPITDNPRVKSNRYHLTAEDMDSDVKISAEITFKTYPNYGSRRTTLYVDKYPAGKLDLKREADIETGFAVPGVLYVEESFIEEPYRGMGYGSRLYDAAIKDAKEQGFTRLYQGYPQSAQAKVVWDSLKRRYPVKWDNESDAGYYIDLSSAIVKAARRHQLHNTLYHGTCKQNLPSILKDGLKPTGGMRNLKRPAHLNELPSVSMTAFPDSAKSWASRGYRTHGENITCKPEDVVILKIDCNKLDQDDDAWASDTHYVKVIPPEAITVVESAKTAGLGIQELKHEFDMRPDGPISKQEVLATTFILPDGYTLGFYDHPDAKQVIQDEGKLKVFCIRTGTIWSDQGKDLFNMYKRPNSIQMTRIEKMFQLNGGKLSWNLHRGPGGSKIKETQEGYWTKFLRELALVYQMEDREELKNASGPTRSDLLQLHDEIKHDPRRYWQDQREREASYKWQQGMLESLLRKCRTVLTQPVEQKLMTAAGEFLLEAEFCFIRHKDNDSDNNLGEAMIQQEYALMNLHAAISENPNEKTADGAYDQVVPELSDLALLHDEIKDSPLRLKTWKPGVSERVYHFQQTKLTELLEKVSKLPEANKKQYVDNGKRGLWEAEAMFARYEDEKDPEWLEKALNKQELALMNAHNALLAASWHIKSKPKTAASELKDNLMRWRGNMAGRAQKVYDEWEQDEEGIDIEYGAGGICDMISMEITDLLESLGVSCTEGGAPGDDHAWTIAYDQKTKEAYGVDIHHSVYETGGGYSWKKIPDVQFTALDVDIWPIDFEDLELEKEESDQMEMFSRKEAYIHTRDEAKALIEKLKAYPNASFKLWGSLARRKKESDHDMDIKVIPGPNFDVLELNKLLNSLGFVWGWNSWEAAKGMDMLGYTNKANDRFQVEFWFPPKAITMKQVEEIADPTGGSPRWNEERFNDPFGKLGASKELTMNGILINQRYEFEAPAFVKGETVLQGTDLPFEKVEFKQHNVKVEDGEGIGIPGKGTDARNVSYLEE